MSKRRRRDGLSDRQLSPFVSQTSAPSALGVRGHSSGRSLMDALRLAEDDLLLKELGHAARAERTPQR
jgi:hypothetical protein